MTKFASAIGTAAIGSFILALPAQAHDGDHSAAFLANVVHWLSSPTHALLAVFGGLATSALMLKLARKSRA